MLISIRWGLTKVLSNRHLLWSLSNWNALQRRQNCCCCLCICVKRSKSVRKREMRRENHNYIISVWLFILHSNVRFLLFQERILMEFERNCCFVVVVVVISNVIRYCWWLYKRCAPLHKCESIELERESTQITSQQQIDIETEWQI